jgi:hypothetical protein
LAERGGKPLYLAPVLLDECNGLLPAACGRALRIGCIDKLGDERCIATVVRLLIGGISGPEKNAQKRPADCNEPSL